MLVCRVCGDEKDDREFASIPFFTKYKRHKVIWCSSCQKMWIQMMKEKQRLQRFIEDPTKFVVSFQ